VILDALATGVPVITTKASAWKDLEDYKCGWVTDISVDGICESLREAISKSREQLKDMGERGRKLVESKYTWNISAQKTIKLYDWLLGRSDRPEFVITD
jgi:glycosyltransferase involved in cell wall biosynthesis